jgi:hypothetical protein
MRCAWGDRTIDVDLNFGIVGPLVVVVRNASRITHVKGVELDGGLFDGRGGRNTATSVGGFFKVATLAAVEGFALEDMSLWLSLGALATSSSSESSSYLHC